MSRNNPITSGAAIRLCRFHFWKDLQLAFRLQISYNPNCPRETNTYQEVSKMFFFGFNSNCNTNCSSIWQILSQLCGFGC